ncbi:MAG: RagB/SusD family nutrient uptake outer membrane protein, partial [Cytophagaceae bacterium]
MISRTFFSYVSALCLGTVLLVGCTKLDETLYDRVTSGNFFQTRDDVYRSFLRTFEHGYWTVQGAQFIMQELPADQLMTPNREGDWYDGGQYIRAHGHTWTTQDSWCNDGWNNLYQGITLATNSLQDIEGLDPAKFNLTVAQQQQLIAELRTMRAWYYIRLYDLYRNVEIITAVKGQTTGTTQSTPQETFAFIERELKESLPLLAAKGDAGTEQFQGRWTKAGAMTLLARLYLNAKVYIGQDRYTDCATICQDLVDGKYGAYSVATRWDAPFDWNNDQS